jgi:hypothetical protein
LFIYLFSQQIFTEHLLCADIMLGWSKIRYLLPSKNEKEDRHHQMITQLGQAWWFRLVIPAALGAEIGGLWLEASPGKVSIRPNPKKKKKKTWGQGPEFNP